MKQLFNLAVCLLLSASLFGQANPSTAPIPAVVYTYHKVKSDQVAGFLANVQVRKKIAEVRKAEKTMLAWLLYEVNNNPEYNYVFVSLYSSYEALENGGNTTSKPAALKVMSLQQYEASTAKLDETFVKRDFTMNTEGFWKEGVNWEHKFAGVSFLKTTGEGNYRSLYREFWVPVHKARAEAGLCEGVQLTQLIRGDGSMHHFNAMTVQLYKNYKQTEPNFDGPRITPEMKKAHPNLTEEQMKAKIAEIDKSRTLYFREQWKLVDMIKP